MDLSIATYPDQIRLAGLLLQYRQPLLATRDRYWYPEHQRIVRNLYRGATCIFGLHRGTELH